MKPTLNPEEIKSRLVSKKNKSQTKLLEDVLNLSDAQISLVKFALSKEEFTVPALLSEKIKKIPLEIISAAPIDEAISSVGGISLDEVDENFQLKKLPGNFVVGEMLDWDAPTGGYLLQACFSMGHLVAQKINLSL